MHDTVVTNAPTPSGSGEPPAGLDRRVLTESTSIVVDAAPAFTEAAVRPLDLAAPLARALDALDAGGRFALLPTRTGRGRLPLALGLAEALAGRPLARSPRTSRACGGRRRRACRRAGSRAGRSAPADELAAALGALAHDEPHLALAA